jgi:hypothetical protein
MRTRLMTLAVVFALVPALGACGGDDDVDVDDTTTLPPATAKHRSAAVP